MELTAQPLSHTQLLSCSTSLLFHSKPSFPPPHSSISFARNLKFVCVKGRRATNLGAVDPSEGQSISTEVAERWLLEPVGDGDTKHIGFQAKTPDAFEIAANEVTVGRLPDKADMVIPVATVSGLHARIQKKEGNLLVTDLDSTNGTFVDNKRLRPGVAVAVSSGSRITFGDTHLAMFRVSKLEKVEVATASDEKVVQTDAAADGGSVKAS